MEGVEELAAGPRRVAEQDDLGAAGPVAFDGLEDLLRHSARLIDDVEQVPPRDAGHGLGLARREADHFAEVERLEARSGQLAEAALDQRRVRGRGRGSCARPGRALCSSRTGRCGPASS